MNPTDIPTALEQALADIAGAESLEAWREGLPSDSLGAAEATVVLAASVGRSSAPAPPCEVN